ncbi:MAG: hypothetical protein ACE5LU_29380 [Anaerolineae bacterium]
MDPQKHLAFRSESQRVPYTFLYPADWQVRETVEEERAKVFIIGPRDQEDTFSVGFTVRIWPASAQMPEAAMYDLLSRFSQMPGFRETGRGSELVAGRPAVEVEFAYDALLPLNSRNPQKKTIRHRHIFLKDNDTLVELIYVAPDEMYDTWLSDFHTLVHSFRRVKEYDDAKFHSLIGTSEAAVVREATADYEAETGSNCE